MNFVWDLLWCFREEEILNEGMWMFFIMTYIFDEMNYCVIKATLTHKFWALSRTASFSINKRTITIKSNWRIKKKKPLWIQKWKIFLNRNFDKDNLISKLSEICKKMLFCTEEKNNNYVYTSNFQNLFKIAL